MLENTESLLGVPQKKGKLKVITAGFDPDSLEELDRLLRTLDVDSIARHQVSTRTITPATYLGRGKVDELKNSLEQTQADAVIIDVELSPNQLRNLEKILSKPILDRPGIIIEIFSRHARTKEAKTQVSLARLQYLLPRLAHFWTHFERQRGGGKLSRGMGEKQIEVDRRLVKTKISFLRNQLKEIENERKIRRQGRKDILKVAIVGYTNAGKSTLLNQMTDSKVLAEDKLFATLDASVRLLNPNSHPPVVAIDTVGFISNLPVSLIASFRSTLEELKDADLLVHVVDASAEQAREQMEVTESVLNELGVGDKPRMIVLNKVDLVQGSGKVNQLRVVSPGAIRISALNPDDVRRLRDKILEHFRSNLEVWEIMLPYAESKLESQLHAHGSVEISRPMEKGSFYRVRIAGEWAKKLGLQRYKL